MEENVYETQQSWSGGGVVHKTVLACLALMHTHTHRQDVLHHYNWGNWARVSNGVRQGLKLMSQKQADVTAKEKQM